MRLLWFSHVVPYPPKAGVLLRAYHLLKGVALAHEVDLIAFIQEPLLRTFYPSVQEALADCRAELERHCRSVVLLPIVRAARWRGRERTAVEGLLTGRSYIESWLDSPTSRAAIQRALAGRSYDVAHFDCLSLAPYRDLLGRTPVTLGHHNAESHMLARRAENASAPIPKRYYQLEGRRLARFERAIAAQFALHITCSDLDSERLRETMPQSRFLSIPNGVDVDYFQPRGEAERPHSLIFVGTLNWYPNIDAVMYLLQEMWPLLSRRVPGVTLDIVGAGAPESIKILASRCPGVTLHGYVPEIRSLMDSASLYVCPIRDGGGTKLKILDAMAMSKCIVAHPIACEGIDLEDGKSVIYAETPEQYTHRIAALLADPARRQLIGGEARKRATSGYSFARLADKFAGSLEQEASGRSPSHH